MESTSQETNTSSQPNHGPSLSALADAIAKQEQFFEQSLMSQQLWAKQLADAQEAKIKEAAQKIKVGAAEVHEILKGKDIIALEVKPERFDPERDNEKWEPQSHLPSREFLTSKSRSTSLSQYPDTEVYNEYRRHSPRDHARKRDHYKDHQRPRSWDFRYRSGDSKGRNYPRVSKSPDDDNNPHYGRSVDRRKHRERRGASPLEQSLKRERSPSKSKHQRYCCEDPDYYDDSTPHNRKSIDGRKHRERRDASPLERSRKKERRSPSKREPQSYRHEDSCSPRSGSWRYGSGDGRAKDYRRACRSPVDDSNPHHEKSIDIKKHREKRGASPLEKSRHLSAEDQNDRQRLQ